MAPRKRHAPTGRIELSKETLRLMDEFCGRAARAGARTVDMSAPFGFAAGVASVDITVSLDELVEIFHRASAKD